MHIKQYNEFNSENVIETKNIANPGDWIIRAKTENGEQYVIRPDKFPKLYDINSNRKPSDKQISDLGFEEYKTIPDSRTALVCDRETLDIIKSKISDDITSQTKMLEIVKSLKDRFIFCKKRENVYARKATKVEEIITIVKGGKEEEVIFEPSWGGTMPICEDDVLIVTNNSVYRVAIYEFEQTYIILNK